MTTVEKSKKRTVLGSLDKLAEQMTSLLEIDHPCAQRYIADARNVVEVSRSLLCITRLYTVQLWKYQNILWTVLWHTLC